jgi:hypothetical protein
MPYPYALVFQTIVLLPEARSIEGDLDNIDPPINSDYCARARAGWFRLDGTGSRRPSGVQPARVRLPTRPF